MKKIIFLLLLSIVYSQQTITQTASSVRIKNLTYVEDTGKNN